MRLFHATLLTFTLLGVRAAAQEQAPQVPPDQRFEKPKNYNGYFPWTPPTSKEQWQRRRQIVREQVLVANGLWPLPEKTPLNPVIHGKIARDGYTIEKVYFASMPGHYVSGNLYRPTGKKGRLPAILNPHGHWANGRFYEANDREVASQLKQRAETTPQGAKYPLQARCAQLARMGCVVFHYDMVGYADSKPIAHREGFRDVQAELRLQSAMGLQTWNSIRALDFLSSLPDVDPNRIGVTGASGGGTQTFILCAIDDRPAAAFPAVMVSTAMQGGCICENCSYLRIDTGNIELAALFAPKPLGMAAANDWTKDIETKGLPQLKALYKLYGAEDRLMGKAHLEFGHNYNQVSRELMYNFFNRHLKLGLPEPVRERPFEPVPPAQLRVYDAEHPLPKDAVDATTLRRTMTAASEKQMQALLPQDRAGLQKFRAVLLPALRAMITDELPTGQGEVTSVGGHWKGKIDDLEAEGGFLSRKGRGEVVPYLVVRAPKQGRTDEVVVWVHPDGLRGVRQGAKLTPAARRVIDSGRSILAVEVFRTGATADTPRPHIADKGAYAGYYFGYNRPLLAQRVRDILTAVAFARGGAKTVHLLGEGKAGPWVLLARGLCGEAVTRTAASAHHFRFEGIKDFDDPMLLPGALKYGGLFGLAALAAPGELYVHEIKGAGRPAALRAAYQASGQAARLQIRAEAAPAQALEWLIRK